MSKEIDSKINELFSVVRKQKAEVEAAEKESKQSWKTNCSIVMPFGASETPVNLQTASQGRIKSIVMGLLNHKEYAQEAEIILGLEKSSDYNGFSYDDWIDDCKKRIAVLNIRAKKEKLATLEKRLNDIVSPEQKREMELEAIMKEMS